ERSGAKGILRVRKVIGADDVGIAGDVLLSNSSDHANDGEPSGLVVGLKQVVRTRRLVHAFADRIGVLPKFLRQHFVDDNRAWRVGGVMSVEVAAADPT